MSGILYRDTRERNQHIPKGEVQFLVRVLRELYLAGAALDEGEANQIDVICRKVGMPALDE